MEEILFRYNPWWEGKFELEGILARPSVLNTLKNNLNNRQIVFLTGLRRVGKTTLLKLIIQYLIKEKKVDPKLIFYISLDDYSLSKKAISEVIEEYRKAQKLSFKDKVYLFLDEVAYQDNFELQLKNLYDSQNVKIFASSSSASILRSKKSFLTGRNMIIEVLPLDFAEFLEFRQIKVKKSDKHLLEKYFEEYLSVGGMPEFVLRGEITYLQELVDDIIYKDIASFYGIRNPQVLKDFFVLLMERAGKVISINKIANILEISPDSAKRYLKMFADSYLIYLVPRFGKTNETLISPKKIYAADLGIRTFFTGFRDKGSLFENYIYLKIKDRKPKYIYQNSTEIDFITSDKELIEVKFGSEMTKNQEQLFNEFRATKKTVIGSFSDLDKIS